MKKLFLTSSFVEVAKYFEEFAAEEIKGKTVTFIPTASIAVESDLYLQEDRKALEQLGIKVDELEITKSSTEEISSRIEKNDYIFVAGGNTFYLLQELRRSGADKIIIKEINRGKLYIGASAGSAIVSPSIEYVGKMDDRGKVENLKDYRALEIVDFYPLPHYTNEPFKAAAEEIILEFGGYIKLIPISNSQVIEVTGGSLRIVGHP